jgi:hypothetical protein
MKQLTSNRDLFDYLVSLSGILKERNESELAEEVLSAAKTAAGNMSAEFLGESRNALRRTQRNVQSVLAQLDAAFDRK